MPKGIGAAYENERILCMKKTILGVLSISIITCLASCSAPDQTSKATASAVETTSATTDSIAAETPSTAAATGTQTTAPEKSWEPKLSEEDRAIIEKLGTLTHHTPVTEDSLNWSFDASSGTLTVSGQGPMKDYSKDNPSPAQEYADKVTRIVVGDGVTTIGSYAFYNMLSCVNAKLPDSVEYIGDYAFADDCYLEEIPFPTALREIGDHAFSEVKLHKPLVIPEGVEIIGNRAFVSNDCYDTISIPASAYYIAETAFCTSLGVHEFTVADANPNYTAKDGVLFSKDMSVLLCYPIYKDENHYDIPQTVRRIAEEAFKQNYFLKTVSIPASVSKFGDGLFLQFPYMKEYNVDPDCPVLTSVDGILYSKDMKTLYDYPCNKAGDEFTVPASVDTLANSCLSFCGNLKKLYVPGTVKTVERNAFGFYDGELYLTENFVNAEVEYTSLYCLTEQVLDFTNDLVYTPPAKRESGADPVTFSEKQHDKMKVYYEGTQEQWDTFVGKAGLFLGDTEVICNTPFPVNG